MDLLLPSYRFPYIVERVYSAVYKVHRIEIESESARQDGVLTEKVRQYLIRMIVAQSKKRNTFLCIVFGVNDCVYTEPSGLMTISDEPPSGGLDLYGTYDKPPTMPNGPDVQSKSP